MKKHTRHKNNDFCVCISDMYTKGKKRLDEEEEERKDTIKVVKVKEFNYIMCYYCYRIEL